MINKFSCLQASCLLLIILSAFSGCQAQSDGNKSGIPRVSTGASIARPADEGKIIIFVPDYEIVEMNLDYLQALPVPKFDIVFEQNNLSVEPTNEIKKVLDEHWKAAVKYFYEQEFVNPPMLKPIMIELRVG